MDIYNYHPYTGEFVSAGFADEDPVDLGNWLIPAYAVTVKPPVVGQNEVAVWDGNAWLVKQDFRGTEYWLPDGTRAVIKVIGDVVPADASTTPPPPPSDAYLQAEKLRGEFESKVQASLGDFMFSEVASWPKQEAEARAVIADETSVTPLIDALVIARGLGETRIELANKIIANADAYAQVVGALLGEYQAKLKAIEVQYA
jgi:hypothetical protein